MEYYAGWTDKIFGKTIPVKFYELKNVVKYVFNVFFRQRWMDLISLIRGIIFKQQKLN